MWVTKDLILKTKSLRNLIESCRLTTIWRHSNHVPSPSPANYARLKIVTDLDAFSPRSEVFDPEANKIRACAMSEGKLKEYMRELRNSLDEITRKLTLRWRAPGLRSEKMWTRSAPTWNGLYQILEVVSDQVFVVKHLVSKCEKKAHASRLQFHFHKEFNEIIRLQEQISHEKWKFTVNAFKDFRKEGKEYQVLTRWLGIVEPVWEAMDIMCHS